MNHATSILDIPEARARVSPITVAQYHEFPEFNENGNRTELIRGIVFEKMSKSPLHSAVASALFDLLRTFVPPGFWLRKEEPLTLVDSEPEPDLSLVRGNRSEFRIRHPSTAALVVEIAISSLSLDREKATMYAQAGVEEYWIVRPVEGHIEVYRRPESGTYLDRSIASGDTSIQCLTMPGVEVRLGELFN